MDHPKRKRNSAGLTALEEFRNYAHQILILANRGLPRFDFLREVTKLFLDHSTFDAVEIRTESHRKWNICEGIRHPQIAFQMGIRLVEDFTGGQVTCLDDLSTLVAGRLISRSSPFLTDQGSLWINDATRQIELNINRQGTVKSLKVNFGDDYKSLVIIPFAIDGENDGQLILKCVDSHSFSEWDVKFYEGIVSILGLAVVDRRTKVALRERVKELTCLYGIARLIEDSNRSFDEIMQGIVELIPPGWMYPEITSGRIVLDDRIYKTHPFRKGPQRLVAPVVVNGQQRGKIEVIYAEKRHELDEGPFLKEERNLINAIAGEVAHILEYLKAEEEKAKLQEQLRHADRLATIGQLAAGIAHELNEPLGNILGFTQLAQKSTHSSDQLKSDLNKIVDATLHAREIIKKLMVFARQTPSQLEKININNIVKEGLSFIETRCKEVGIHLVLQLEDALPEIIADATQLKQVLINLAVNAVHAMPDGGTLTVRTRRDELYLYLIVEDTGIGMSEDIKKRIFLPFFTTKDVDEGTGLGLPVVHGIVTSHGGSIKVESKIGEGSKFIIQLPLANSG
jgi:signal transduction histidine kinase